MQEIDPSARRLWETMSPTFERIITHPFIRELVDGTLPEAAFVRYLVQDDFYLREYGRCWALLGARSPVLSDLVEFTGKVNSSLREEQETQVELLDALGFQQADLMSKAEPTPSCLAFNNFIKEACGTRAYHEGFVAVLECPWVYWELAKRLAVEGSRHPVYQKWIDGYALGEIGEATIKLLEIWKRIAADLGPRALESADDHARLAVRYDWMFWDSAYRDERWPI